MGLVVDFEDVINCIVIEEDEDMDVVEMFNSVENIQKKVYLSEGEVVGGVLYGDSDDG